MGIAMNHINKLESLQSKILRTIVNAPWYIRNEDIRKELKIPTAKEEIGRYAEKYKERTATHPNQLLKRAKLS